MSAGELLEGFLAHPDHVFRLLVHTNSTVSQAIATNFSEADTANEMRTQMLF